MYYSYPCPYCGKVFYTFNTNREQASHTLYQSIKQHLIDYNEDHKEYEMDDGEQADSNQIYSGMSESNEPPAGGYEAEDVLTDASHSTGSAAGSPVILIFLIIFILIIILFLFFPDIISFINQLIHF